MSDKRLNVAFIGCGNQSAWLMRAIRKHARLVAPFACFDVNADVKAAFAEAHGLRAFDSLEALAESGADVFVVATPPATHATVGIQLLDAVRGRRRIALVVEKPSATRRQDHDALAAAAREARAVLTFGFDKTLSGVLWLKELVDAGRLGEPVLARTTWLRVGGAPERGVFLDRELSGGGPGMDLLSHQLSLACALLDGRFAAVQATTSTAMFAAGGSRGGGRFAHATVEDTIDGRARLELPSGPAGPAREVPVNFTTAWDLPLERDEFTFEVFFTRGRARLTLEAVGDDDERLVPSALVLPYDDATRALAPTAKGFVELRPASPTPTLWECRATVFDDAAGVHLARLAGEEDAMPRVTEQLAGIVLKALLSAYGSAARGGNWVPVDR